MANTSLLSLDNPVFSAFACYTCVLVLKILFLGLLTSFNRIVKNVYENYEDCSSVSDKLKPRKDERVERLRRNHLNDLENMLPYMIVGFLYVTINPTLSTALWHFRIFTIARFAHTFVYQFAVPQPSRVLCHIASLAIIISMIVQILQVVH